MESRSTWREFGFVLLSFPSKVDETSRLSHVSRKSSRTDALVCFLASLKQEQVQSNADLDIPTQQELLAQFRCDEIATVAIDAFLANLKGVKRPVETGQVLEGLGKMLAEWKALALSKSLFAGLIIEDEC